MVGKYLARALLKGLRAHSYTLYAYLVQFTLIIYTGVCVHNTCTLYPLRNFKYYTGENNTRIKTLWQQENCLGQVARGQARRTCCTVRTRLTGSSSTIHQQTATLRTYTSAHTHETRHTHIPRLACMLTQHTYVASTQHAMTCTYIDLVTS